LNLSALADNSFSSSERGSCFEPGQIARHTLIKKPKLLEGLDPDSMDLYFQGMASLNKGWIAEHVNEASALFKRALARDPANIEASLGAAFADYVRCVAFLVDDRTAFLTAAEETVTKLLSRVPDHPFAHLLLGRIQIQSTRPLQGAAECQRALALDGNLAGAHAVIGIAKLVA
jgi:hypothetical protein